MSDGDGGGGESARVADVLRARMADGSYPLNSLLPPQRHLAEELGVSRDTVQRVLRELRAEGWIETRQGMGTRVVRAQHIHSLANDRHPEGTVTLRSVIDRAFGRREVTLDVFTLTCESLDAHLRLQIERIRAGEISPQRITLRVLSPAQSLSLPYWRTSDLADDELLRERLLAMTERHVASVKSVLRDLEAQQLVPSVDLEIRRVSMVPHFKLYLLNGAEAVLGHYVPYMRNVVLEDGREIERVLDVSGAGVGLAHHVTDENPNSQGTVFVNSFQEWFDAVWEHLTV